MRSRSSGLRAVGAGALLVLFVGSGSAAETANSEFVIIPAGDTVSDDLYAGAIKVIVEGEIDGDLVAFAAEEVVINGSVTGSVVALAPNVTVNGVVGGSLRVTAKSLSVNGEVGHDIVVAAASVRLGKSSSVGADVLAWTLDMEALGHVGGDLSGSQRSLALGGSVDGDVDVSVRDLEVVAPLTVVGDFGYRSTRDATGLEMADVDGVVVHKTPLPPNIRVRALGFFSRFMVILFLTIAALTVSWSWPQRTAQATDAVGESPLAAWLTGAVVMLSPLLLALVAALILVLAPSSASFPLLAIFGPLILAATGVVFASSLVAGVPVVGRLGARLFKRLDTYGAVLAGSTITGVVWVIPIVGWLVPLLILPLGMGAWMRSRHREESDSVDAHA